ncbi:MAG: hypothetical protein H6Q41_4512, partial [Deltaproteobacteria bacterium]|nr:hypothetical protein [Deltaproteobacteria bacterium]
MSNGETPGLDVKEFLGFWDAFRAPAPQIIIILEHFLEVFSSKCFLIFAKGFIKKSLWESI